MGGGVELQDLVNQSADVQKEDNVEFLNLREESNLPWPMQDLVNQSAEEDTVELSWAPWPCPKKGPWPAPPLCGEGRIELQYEVNQSADVQKEDNVKLQGWHPFKKAAAWAKKFGKKVVNGKACIDVGIKVGIPVGGKLCFR